jgi:outer membrane protein
VLNKRVLLGLAGLVLLAPVKRAVAQPEPEPPVVAEPAEPTEPTAPDVLEQPAEPPAPRPDPLRQALVPVQGGLTANEVARLGATTSYNVRARQAELRAAAARVDEALVGYFPRLTLTASYTRLSEIDNDLATGGGALLGAANEGQVTTGPCPGNPAITCVLDAAGLPVQAQALDFSFPSLPNQYSVVASLSVPISDYILRLRQAYKGTKNLVDARELDVQAARLTAAADAKVAFYNWQRAKGQVVVAAEAVEQARAHVEDANRVFEAGLISQADVLRLEAQLARAEGLYVEAQAFELVAEQQIRTLTHLPPDTKLESAEDVFASPNIPELPPLEQMMTEAEQNRIELAALREQEEALEQAESAVKAAYAPRLEGFANAQYANPNPRVFPQQNQWDLTWDLGVRLTWTVNETFSTFAAAAEAEAQTELVGAQRMSLRDAIRVEVAGAYADVAKSESAIEAATRELEAAEESLRVRRKLFQFGRATSVDLIDAETELTRARLAVLSAYVDFLVAEVRLEHATGRDAPQKPG